LNELNANTGIGYTLLAISKATGIPINTLEEVIAKAREPKSAEQPASEPDKA